MIGASKDELHHRDRCAIVGIGQTDYSRCSGRSDLTLATQAALAAIDDAGLEPEEIDGIVRCDMDTVYHHDLIESAGLPNITYWSEVGPGGVAPAAMVGQAVGAILSGQATNVLVFRELNGRSGRRYGLSSATSHVVGGGGSYDELYMPYGLLTPGQVFAVFAQRHMIEFGTTPEQLAHIPLVCRKRANANPQAQMHDRTMTLDDYLEARMISAPLRLFDFCLETDGACAVVVSRAEQAKDSPHPPVLIRAVAQATTPSPQPGMMYPVLARPDLTSLPATAAADLLYRRAGLGPDDIDVGQFYDCFSITVLLQLEDWGFCKKGEGGPFVEDGKLRLGGALPLNPDGGGLSSCHPGMRGIFLIVEAVRQLRGQAGPAQVDGANVAVACGSGGWLSCLGVAVLGNEHP
jgi:acetyl-CoA acetyltransferase